jgi:hypothetical protein
MRQAMSGLSKRLFALSGFGLPVPGLVPDRPWDHLPVQGWITNPQWQVTSLSACLAACDPPALVGALAVSGEAKRAMLELVNAPQNVERFLRDKAVRDGNPKRKAVHIHVFTEKLTGERPGFLLFMARIDGTRPVHAVVLAGTISPDGPLPVAFAFAASREAALWQAQAAARALP